MYNIFNTNKLFLKNKFRIQNVSVNVPIQIKEYISNSLEIYE